MDGWEQKRGRRPEDKHKVGTGTGSETGKGTIMKRERVEEESSDIRKIRKEAEKTTRHYHSAPASPL